MIGTVDGKHAIIDIKTTYQYHPLYLSYQLTLYKMAYEQMTGEKIEKAYCVWLPKKDLGQLYVVSLSATTFKSSFSSSNSTSYSCPKSFLGSHTQ